MIKWCIERQADRFANRQKTDNWKTWDDWLNEWRCCALV